MAKKIISAVAGLADAQAGINGSFLWSVLVAMEENNERECKFFNIKFVPNHGKYRPCTYFNGSFDPKDDIEFQECLRLVKNILNRKRGQSQDSMVEEAIRKIFVSNSATKADIVTVMPIDVMEAIFDEMAKSLLILDSDLVYIRSNNRRQKTYTLSGFGKFFIEDMGGVSQWGINPMQEKINAFKAAYMGSVFFKKLKIIN